MDIEEAIYKRRTIRRFKQDPISLEILKKLIDFARVAPMGNNIQSLDFIIVLNKEMKENLFACLGWAGSLPPEMRIPEEGRRPSAYIIVLGNTDIKQVADSEEGAAVQNILLGAINFGIATCWMGSVDRDNVRDIFNVPKNFKIMHVISLGYPDEESVMEPFKNTFKYWKDERGVMHIPKRSLEDVIFKIY
jgi:nitroreductase